MGIKQQIAKQLAGNCKLDRQVMSLKRSWDEVSDILNGRAKKSGKHCKQDKKCKCR